MNRFACLVLPMLLFAPHFLWPQEAPRKTNDHEPDVIVVGEVKNIIHADYERRADDPKNEMYIATFSMEMVVKAVEKGSAVKVGDVIEVSGRRITKTPVTLSLYRGQMYRAFRVPVKGGRGFIVREDSEIDMSIPAREKRIQEALAKLAKGEIDAKDFSVTYNDMNPFHGGLHLAIHGDGKVEQEAVRQEVRETKKVSAADMKKLIDLLNQHKAWEQRFSHRQVIQPGESVATLQIRYKLDSVMMWEYHSELAKNNRVLAIRETMKRVAWKDVRK